MSQKTTDELQKEFTNLAIKAGSLQYEINEKSRELEGINLAMRDISLDFAKLKTAEIEAAKVAAEQPKSE